MNNSDIKIKKIKKFIDDYVKNSQLRGSMYGSIGQLESNWVLLNQISFILDDIEDKKHDINFAAYLCEKGFGTKDAKMIVDEKNTDTPYLELNKMWNDYIEWKNKKTKR